MPRTVSTFDVLFVMELDSTRVQCSATRARSVRVLSICLGTLGQSGRRRDMALSRALGGGCWRSCLAWETRSESAWGGQEDSDSDSDSDTFGQPTMYIAEHAMTWRETCPNSTLRELPAGRGNYDRAGEKCEPDLALFSTFQPITVRSLRTHLFFRYPARLFRLRPPSSASLQSPHRPRSLPQPSSVKMIRSQT